MPQDITINGAQYPDVPAVQIPKTGGGTAQFDDTTDATATASEIASGKTAYVNNTRLLGTGQMVEPPLYIDDSINSIGIGEAPTATNYLVNTLNSSFRGQYNNFYSMPYSWSTAGVDGVGGYARIATITARGTASYLSMPIRFEVFRTYDSKPINMYLRLAFTADYNPSIEGLYYERGDGIYNNSFFAFARKTGTGTYDVYVRKETASTWIGVNTYIPAYMLFRMAVSYANDLYTFVPSDAVIATELHIINEAKYNTFNYMPYSWAATGGEVTIGYARIARITFTVATAHNIPLEFEIYHRFRNLKETLTVTFDTGNAIDPAVTSLYKSSSETTAFIHKVDASVWDLYIYKSTGYDYITVRCNVPMLLQTNTTVTFAENQLSSVPSGAVMAIVAPCLNPTVTITQTSGSSTVSGIHFYRSGNVCHLRFSVYPTTAISSGVIFQGTTSAPSPVDNSFGMGTSGNSLASVMFTGGGSITVRAIVGSFASGTGFVVALTYLTDN